MSQKIILTDIPKTMGFGLCEISPEYRLKRRELELKVALARILRLEQEVRVYEAHINVTCERCGRESSKDLEGNEYHLHNNSRFCDLADSEGYKGKT